jgi:tRNA(adenine34) deaminase
MCAGAITQSRFARVVFGAFDEKSGAAGSVWDLIRDPRLPNKIEVITGLLADESAEVLKDFFIKRR